MYNPQHAQAQNCLDAHLKLVLSLILTIKSLSNTRSAGSDKISLKFIKDALYYVAYYLACIMNTSIASGVFPGAWNHAYIVPLFKKSGFNDVNN